MLKHCPKDTMTFIKRNIRKALVQKNIFCDKLLKLKKYFCNKLLKLNSKILFNFTITIFQGEFFQGHLKMLMDGNDF